MIFFSKKKVTKFIFSIFIFHSSAKFQTKKEEEDLSWNVYLNVFNHIVRFLKNYINFHV
jgi:hypothetical protein